MEVETIVVRYATTDDLTVVHRFVQELEWTEFNASAMESIFRANLLNLNNIYLVAECDGQVVGFISCHIQLLMHHAGWVGEIQELFVPPAWRSKGIGKKLLTRLRELATEKGVGQLEVTAHTSRTAAHQFYESEGFLQTHKKFVITL